MKRTPQKCRFINPVTGKQCQAIEIQGSSDHFCFQHSTLEEIKEKRNLSRSRGGLATKAARVTFSEDFELSSVEDVLKLERILVNAVLQGKMDRGRGRDVSAMLKDCGDIIESKDVKEQVKRLKKIATEQFGATF